MTAKEEQRVIAPLYDKKGKPYWPSTMTPPSNVIGACLMVPDRVIPVIFVPGVMGSNLKGLGTAAGVSWRLDSAVSMLPWLTRGAVLRKQYLAPSLMEVDDGGAIPQGTIQHAEELRRRGWGEVGAMSYAEILIWLETALNDFEYPEMGERVALMQRNLGASQGEEPLSRDDVALSYRYRFPVHACGYNWLASNADSAARLGRRIDQVVERYKAEKLKCEKVIIVTHSMGGLVARHCSEVLGYSEKILGIVHGVMPAIGAAAVYRRFKAGVEGAHVPAKILGEDAAEITAVLSGAPGPMQLLPTPEYGNGWLKIKSGKQEFALPQSGDPYGEIYTVRGKWWGMCEDRLINPLNTVEDPAKRQKQVNADWKAFKSAIDDKVKPFHEQIRQRYHANTFAFFGSHPEFKAYGTVTWEASYFGAFPNRKADVLGARQLSDSELKDENRPAPEVNRGRTVEAEYVDKGWFPKSTRSFFISEPDEPGDGTVPRRSGVAPQSFVKSLLQVKVGHEPAYKASEGPDNVKACQFTLRSIVKIAQRVQETSLRY